MAPTDLVALADRDYDPPAPPGTPPVDDPLQPLTRRLAGDPATWGAAEADEVRRRFDERSVDWETRDNPVYRLPLEDALERGGVAPGGRCLEVGSGTGLQTPTLLGHFDVVVALDLSLEMLRRTPAGRGHLVNADASRLPLRSGTFDAVVLVNAFLFPGECLRVLGDRGAVVSVSTRGDQTPIYLAPADVASSLRRIEGGLEGRTARAGQGCWTVLRRAGRG